MQRFASRACSAYPASWAVDTGVIFDDMHLTCEPFFVPLFRCCVTFNQVWVVSSGFRVPPCVGACWPRTSLWVRFWYSAIAVLADAVTPEPEVHFLGASDTQPLEDPPSSEVEMLEKQAVACSETNLIVLGES